MKKTLLIIVATIVLAVLLTGCQKQSLPIVNDSSTNDKTINTQGTTAQETEINSCIGLFSIYSYSDDTKFINTTELPEHFVTYEEISEFGEFKGFVRLCHEYQNYSKLFYTFIDENGTEYSMYISYIPLAEESTVTTEKALISADKIHSSDMRTASVTEAGRYLHNGIEYYYYPSGLLGNIKWRCGDIEYTLHGGLQDYPINEKTTAIGKLLNLESADQVASSVKSYTSDKNAADNDTQATSNPDEEVKDMH